MLRRSESESRTDASSSTMNTVSRCIVRSRILGAVYRKAKAEMTARSRLCPQRATVRLHNGAADAQTDPHAARLVRTPRLEQAMQLLFGHSRSAVQHFDQHRAAVCSGPYFNFANA